MKIRYSLLISCVLLSAKIYAQPILNSTCGYQNGSLVHIHLDTNTSLNEGPGGANQVWDFSTLTDPNASADYTGESASLTPYGNDFPMANVASETIDFSDNDNFSYFTNDDAHYTTWGYEASGEKFIYSNPRDILHYPFTYGDSFTDTYYSSLLTGYNSGSVTVLADGYGTLILPERTFQNCLRVKEIRNDTLATGPEPITTNDTTYKFYCVNFPEALCQVNHHHSSDGFDFNEVYWQDVSPNAVASVTQISSLKIFPNPCNDFLTIGFPFENENTVVRITDASGRVMKQEKFSADQKIRINTSDLPSGVYLISFEANAITYRNSIVVSR